MNETRYCRICWNTKDWQHPTGEAAKLETASYVSKHGFGHEEWLLKHGWLIDGYRYGYLQPLHNLRLKSKQNSFDVILYTIAPTRQRFIVGRISNCELTTSDDARNAFRVYAQQGWLDEMIRDLRKLNVNPQPIITAVNNPISIANFRFRPENVELIKPFIPVGRSHKVYRLNRYKPLMESQEKAWSRIINSKEGEPGKGISFRPGKLKSIETRNRAAQEGIAFDPTHDRMQNSIFQKLADLYGEHNVGYEDNAVDIVVRNGSQIAYYEIKTATTAKHCIRLAIGQLLEYAHWVNGERAQKLIVVGPISPSDDAKSYVRYLRERYSLPIYYSYFDLSTNTLSQPY